MSITLQEFNTNFKVQIKNIAIPHVDSTGSQLASIGFNVICIPNSRVQYFEYHFNDQNIVSTYTPSQLIDYAWSNLQSSVNTWATNALTLPLLIGYVYTPLSDFNTTFPNLDITSYNQNYTTKIQRFEVVPPNDPNAWCVGFRIENNKNNDYFYIDTNVSVQSFNVTQAENNVMNTAWDQVKDLVGTWASEKMM